MEAYELPEELVGYLTKQVFHHTVLRRVLGDGENYDAAMRFRHVLQDVRTPMRVTIVVTDGEENLIGARIR